MNDIITINRHTAERIVDWHTHDYTEVIYCTKGSGKIALKNGEIHPYGENDFIVISPHITHMNISDTGFQNIYLMSNQTEFFVDGCIVISDTSNLTVRNIMSQAYFLFQNPEYNTYGIMSSVSSLLFNCIATINKSLRFSDEVEKLRADIIKKYADSSYKIRNATIDNRPITESNLKKFKKELGVTPLQFLTQIRLHNAKKLLLSRRSLDMNITEISRACGFDDLLYFSRVFKKHYKVSPLSYTEITEQS